MAVCRSCNWSTHDASIHTYCPNGHPTDVLGFYVYPGRKPKCRGCQREATARWTAAHKARSRRYRTRWEARKRRARAAQRAREEREAHRNERDRRLMREWVRLAFGYDPRDTARLADALADELP